MGGNPKPEVPKIPESLGLAAFDFDSGTLVLTEASSKKRASIHVIVGRAALKEFDRGGLEVMPASEREIVAALTRERHTLKRALTDPTILSGIGNAYSDEILHAAKLSPLKLTSAVTPDEWTRLVAAIKQVLEERTERIRQESKDGFPERVTAFREDMAVHGRYGKPCPRVRDAGAAHRLRGQRDELLRYVPDRERQAPRGSVAVAPVARGLAAKPRRARGEATGARAAPREPRAVDEAAGHQGARSSEAMTTTPRMSCAAVVEEQITALERDAQRALQGHG